jgi:hypothetical protein
MRVKRGITIIMSGLIAASGMLCFTGCKKGEEAPTEEVGKAQDDGKVDAQQAVHVEPSPDGDITPGGKKITLPEINIEIPDEDIDAHIATTDSGFSYVDNQIIVYHGPGVIREDIDAICIARGYRVIGTGDSENSFVIMLDRAYGVDEINLICDQLVETEDAISSAKMRLP